MIKCVFDTNCIISAHLLTGSVARQAYDAALRSGVLFHSPATLKELYDTFLRSKFDKYVSFEARLEAVEQFQRRSVEVLIHHEIVACRDAKDDKFLSLAVASEVDFIVTGDKDLLVLHPFRGIAIISPSDFLKELRSR